MRIKQIKNIIFAIALTLIIIFVSTALLLRPRRLEIGCVDMSTMEDGTYIGVCQNKILLAVVQVEVSQHKMILVEVVEHKESYRREAEMIANDVWLKQSLDIDAVSGATLTSDTVLKAIENALKKGVYYQGESR